MKKPLIVYVCHPVYTPHLEKEKCLRFRDLGIQGFFLFVSFKNRSYAKAGRARAKEALKLFQVMLLGNGNDASFVIGLRLRLLTLPLPFNDTGFLTLTDYA